MEYRIDKTALLNTLAGWDGFLKKRVHLIACGGTALTLRGVKESTKDVDLLVPGEGEHEHLVKVLDTLGYKRVTHYGWAKEKGFIFDLFKGKTVYTTELLDSPLNEGNNILIKEFSRIYLCALNTYDLIITKIFRGTEVDTEDRLALIRAKKKDIVFGRLKERFRETATYEIRPDKVNRNFDLFLTRLAKEGLI